MADATDITRGSAFADPIVDRVNHSASATVYVPAEEINDGNELEDHHYRTLATDHGITAVFDVVRNAWAFSKGVPEETLRAHAGEEVVQANAAFGDLPGSSDILPPGSPVPEVVTVGPDEPTPVTGAAQAAYPPEVVVEGAEGVRTNAVEATPTNVEGNRRAVVGLDQPANPPVQPDRAEWLSQNDPNQPGSQPPRTSDVPQRSDDPTIGGTH